LYGSLKLQTLGVKLQRSFNSILEANLYSKQKVEISVPLG